MFELENPIDLHASIDDLEYFDQCVKLFNISGILFSYRNTAIDCSENETIASSSLLSDMNGFLDIYKKYENLNDNSSHKEFIDHLGFIYIEPFKEENFEGKLFFVSKFELGKRNICILKNHISLFFSKRLQNSLIDSLQEDLRLQIVLAEGIEWLKSADINGNDFLVELLRRLTVILKIEKGGLHLVSDITLSDINQKQVWFLRNIDNEDFNEIIPEFPIYKKIEKDTIEIRKISKGRTYSRYAMFFTLHVSDIEFANLFLIKNDLGFDFFDQTHIMNFIHMAASIIEKPRFLAQLKKQNIQLKQEKKEQEHLIKELKSTQEKLVQSEKMASIGQLSAGVAHEINNPLGYICSNLSSMKHYTNDLSKIIDSLKSDTSVADKIDCNELEFIKEDLSDLFDETFEGIDRVKTIIADLKDFSHVGTTDMQLCNIHRAIDATLNIVSNELKYKCEIIRDYCEIDEIECVSSQINQVIMNILVNAGHSIESKGTITIKTWVESEYINIAIKDTGKGIEPDHLKNIFDPFFTTKPIGKGTGLGLSISYGIIQNHQGEISVSSKVNEGTCFTITLPIKQKVLNES